MPGIIALAAIAIVALTVLSFAVHLAGRARSAVAPPTSAR